MGKKGISHIVQRNSCSAIRAPVQFVQCNSGAGACLPMWAIPLALLCTALSGPKLQEAVVLDRQIRRAGLTVGGGLLAAAAAVGVSIDVITTRDALTPVGVVMLAFVFNTCS